MSDEKFRVLVNWDKGDLDDLNTLSWKMYIQRGFNYTTGMWWWWKKEHIGWENLRGSRVDSVEGKWECRPVEGSSYIDMGPGCPGITSTYTYPVYIVESKSFEEAQQIAADLLAQHMQAVQLEIVYGSFEVYPDESR